MDYSLILQKVRTKEEVDLLEEEVDAIVRMLFHTNQEHFEKLLKESVRMKTIDLLEEIFLAKKIGWSDKNKIEDFLRGLKKTLGELAVLHLTLAIEPAEGTVASLFAWVRKHMEEKIILDVTYDRTILGGAIIAWKGKYVDYSVQKKLDELFDKQREEIIKLWSNLKSI